MFLIAPELHQKEEECLKRNFDEALSAWGAASTAWRKLGEACPNITLTRNPYDFS